MTGKSVFLDTSFLIASQVKGHEFLERTIKLRNEFLNENTKVLTSPLVLDEFWYVLTGLAKSADKSVNAEKVFEQIKHATRNIFTIDGLTLLDVDLTQKELLETLEIMHRYNLRPRDAMIVKLMIKSKLTYIASFDKDFDRIGGITRMY